MSAADVLEEVTSSGGRVWTENDGRLHYRIPTGADALLDRLREYKPELLRLVSGTLTPITKATVYRVTVSGCPHTVIDRSGDSIGEVSLRMHGKFGARFESVELIT